MMNTNWLVKLVSSYRQALICNYKYSLIEISRMGKSEMELELKKLGYDFKANSPFKTNKST